jgi:hypothetical protein
MGRDAPRRGCAGRSVGPVETEAEAKRVVVQAMRTVGAKLGNTPAVACASYVSPALVEQYLASRTLEDFRPRHLRVVGAATLHSMPRNRLFSACCGPGGLCRHGSRPGRLPDWPSEFRYSFRAIERIRRKILARKTVLVCDSCGKEVGEGKGATLRLSYSDARRGAKQADLCDDCAGKMPGRAAARRGRRPRSVQAA